MVETHLLTWGEYHSEIMFNFEKHSGAVRRDSSNRASEGMFTLKLFIWVGVEGPRKHQYEKNDGKSSRFIGLSSSLDLYNRDDTTYDPDEDKMLLSNIWTG